MSSDMQSIFIDVIVVADDLSDVDTSKTVGIVVIVVVGGIVLTLVATTWLLWKRIVRENHN